MTLDCPECERLAAAKLALWDEWAAAEAAAVRAAASSAARDAERNYTAHRATHGGEQEEPKDHGR